MPNTSTPARGDAMDSTSLTNGALTLECEVNPNIDSSCSCLLSGGGPQLNTDIAGPGVRISFYVQALLLGLLSARSESAEECKSSLYTLISTNIAMVLSAFILGFKPEPGMSLHDAIVVFYLLTISWTAIFFCFPTYNRFKRRDATLQLLYILHSYLIFAFLLAFLITAPTFGATARCNSHAVAVVFGTFPALDAGRIVSFITVGIVILVYSVLSFLDYKNALTELYQKSQRRVANQSGKIRDGIFKLCAKVRDGILKWCGKTRERIKTVNSGRTAEATAENDRETCRALQPVPRDSPSTASKAGDQTEDEKPDKRNRNGRRMCEEYEESEDDGTYKLPVSGRLLAELIVIVIAWALSVMNTELLIVHNRFDGGGNGLGRNLWGFGQVLPMFLTVLPLVNVVKTFKKWKLGKRQPRRPFHRTFISRDFFDEPQPAPNFEFGRDFKQAHGRSPGGGPRPMPRGWNGNGRRTRGDFMSSLFHHFGQQPAAHISVNSLHSDSPNYDVYANTNRTGDRPGPSAPLTSASQSPLSTYRTADDAV